MYLCYHVSKMNSICRTVLRHFHIVRNVGHKTLPPPCISTIALPVTLPRNVSSAFRNETSLLIPRVPGICSCRCYAKTKDKKKEKSKGKIHVNESQLAEIVNVESLKNGIEKCLDHMKEDFVKNLSLRSTTGSIESLKINLDGKEHTLQEVAQVIRKNPKILVINMSVFPQAIPAVLKAIQKSGMNLNPQQDGTTLYVPVPKVTKEFRENLAKNAKQLFIKCKNSIKEVQMKHIKTLKKNEKSEDIVRNAEQQIISLTDSYIAEAEKILDAKQTELIGKE